VRTDGRHRLFRYEAAVRHALLAAGLAANSIECVGGCTAAESELYYSHRASGGTTGRMSMTVWIP
jgi:copper oxidase (laccase) domain-containing protein